MRKITPFLWRDLTGHADAGPAPGPIQVWLIGVGLAALLIYAGLGFALTATATMGTTLWHQEVHGVPAVAYGIGWVFVGAFVHVRYVWPRSSRLRPYSSAVARASLVVASVSLILAFLLA
jgi:hypothetical protein